jgi:orotate phosphoribosyltransferase
MSLFQRGAFKLHSGAFTDWKIDCDALTDEDIETLAEQIGRRFRFGSVEGVPTGGLRLAVALERYLLPDSLPLLIVDDVLTTGASMEEQRAGRDAIGVVIFSRGACPGWVTPIFQEALGL